MAPPGSWTLELQSRGDFWARHVMTEVARVVSRAPAGEALLVEHDASSSSTRLWSAVPGLLGSVYRQVLNLGGGLNPVRAATRSPAEFERHVIRAEIRPAIHHGPNAPVEPPSSSEVRRGKGTPRPDGTPLEVPRPVPPGTSWTAQHHWVSNASRLLYAHLSYRIVDSRPFHRDARRRWSRFLREALSLDDFPSFEVHWSRETARARSAWATGQLTRTPVRRLFSLDPHIAARSFWGTSWTAPTATSPSHTVVFGSSGSGKTAYLAHAGGRWRSHGRPVVGVDLHGDLASRLMAADPAFSSSNWFAIDAARPLREIVGVRVLGSSVTDQRDREAAMVVAAIRRLSSDGEAVYWGFRLERIFDAFVRLVQEQGGGLRDVYALLTEPRLREAARLRTRSRVLAQFLDELPALLQRNPEFLWPAAARLSKVVLLPAVGALLSPQDRALDVERWAESGDSLMLRVPMSTLGPEAAPFVASLLLGAVYLGCVGRGASTSTTARWLFVLDEAHALSPRLLTEILAEGRKFGVQVVMATQYVDRLATELRAAVAGSASRHVFFRVPPAAARDGASWLGLPLVEGSRLVAGLPTGTALQTGSGGTELVEVPMRTSRSAAGSLRWDAATDSTIQRFGSAGSFPELPEFDGLPAFEERVLLAVYGAASSGTPTDEAGLRGRLAQDPDPRVDIERVPPLVDLLLRRGWLTQEGAVLYPTPSGLAALGVVTQTGAVSESHEHRAILLEMVRLFARRGCYLSILRQGRFDRRVPDAVFRQLPDRVGAEDPVTLARVLDQVRASWAWRFFGGRNVHVEAEVSGASRPERIRRGLAKARQVGAFALFAVADAGKARLVRRVLVQSPGFPFDAQVWTVRVAGNRAPPGRFRGAQE